MRCNRRFERMLGLDPGAAAGASLEEIFGRSFGPLGRAREALEALAQGQPFDAELPLAQAGSAALWYSLSVRRARAEGGPTEAVAVLTDITRLKMQQAELEKLLRDRELMFSLSDVGIVYQRGARIERANQAMAVLTGCSAPELNTLDAAELYEDTRTCVDFEAQVGQGLREHGRYDGGRLLRRRDGRLTWVQVTVRRVDDQGDHGDNGDRGEDGDDPGLICSFVDVDEPPKATLAAMQGQKDGFAELRDARDTFGKLLECLLEGGEIKGIRVSATVGDARPALDTLRESWVKQNDIVAQLLAQENRLVALNRLGTEAVQRGPAILEAADAAD